MEVTPVFAAFIITLMFIALFFTILYKVKQVRTRRDVLKAYYRSIYHMCLGALMITFAIVQLSLFKGIAVYIICAILIIYGAFIVYQFNIRRKYFKNNLPIEEEAYRKMETKKYKKK
ncbi:YtpI family protein [Abyssicoccus albus]|uniref:YtpI-like protein n=1 Tax=Abyssicoccus albus TaxID=1817405 RepID=A0A1Q1G292_9BACL|nr:YtpI family protein [Abyssicoccus albus]AQL56483.1 hypothetical protein BVH56_05900 [Abyssicoccus albus]RPF57716.1 YtpI-like protein [Abyssicoccus albus]